MQENELIMFNNRIYRVIEIKDDSVLVIDCINRTMPFWSDISYFLGLSRCTEEHLLQVTQYPLPSSDTIKPHDSKIMHQRFSMISPILHCIADVNERSSLIRWSAELNNVSVQTIRKYLCLFLSYNSIFSLSPHYHKRERILTDDEKNYRWAINKYYYSWKKLSLTSVYTIMLKKKYTDENGKLFSNYPKVHQFRYFFKKYNKTQSSLISREGLSSYQRNNRVMLGAGVQDFATNVGYGMMDSTICDFYVVGESGIVLGRPILTACIDAFSGFCYGFSLTMEAGTDSLGKMLSNVVADKVEYCSSLGISIKETDWNCKGFLPAIFVTDKGKEYESKRLEQITEIGVSIINLPPFRPDLKSVVEKFFDIIQNLYKPSLKGKGVIESDYGERGVRDYKKDACLSIKDFEKAIIHCVLFYNNSRIVKSCYTNEMLKEKVKPYAKDIFEWGRKKREANLINITNDYLFLTLLPRAKGRFTRKGLIIGGLRYKNQCFKEQMLKGGECIVAYNSSNTNCVWLFQDGDYFQFELISSEFDDMSFETANFMIGEKRSAIKMEEHNNIQAKVDLTKKINDITSVIEITQNRGGK